MVHKVREIPVTECPADVYDKIYSDFSPPLESEDDERYNLLVERLNDVDKRKTKKVKPKTETRFERIGKIRKAFPGCEFTWCGVDADNTFEYKGRLYSVPDEMRGYVEDAQMDRILAVESESRLAFYDQNVLDMYVLR